MFQEMSLEGNKIKESRESEKKIIEAGLFNKCIYQRFNENLNQLNIFIKQRGNIQKQFIYRKKKKRNFGQSFKNLFVWGRSLKKITNNLSVY
ncbi:unnamed protein product [Paramecium sonneborni]|uniref:Uncharacterized protein n=1 Tax=Paramecium sonneborni TaxID=65129 RepID=A0A8S1RNQ7_9CILI|nr:unnamed protein product [Paramecium sonneborni]